MSEQISGLGKPPAVPALQSLAPLIGSWAVSGSRPQRNRHL